MRAHEEFWLNEVVFTDLSLFFALSGMLLEYATEAYTGMALATKMFDKHENMVHGDRNGMLSHQQTLPRFSEAEMAICARAGEKDKTLACFDKVVHNDFKSGSRSVWTQLAQLHNSNGECMLHDEEGRFQINACHHVALFCRRTRSKAAGPQDTLYDMRENIKC
jgi:hypothetical protein